MPTPSIQTLRADAQQVLNLDSISAVRSVVAATLANANAGTPLNPNLTTQQLWNEFYQIVTQPKSDIESIIANQLMKFLFAPPAPGGAGANKQVIFNDGGVLAGDADFQWDKTANLLTINGAVNITGGLANSFIKEGTGWIWTSTGTSGGTNRGGIYAINTGILNLFGGSTITSHLQIDPSGNVGIGVTPSAWFSTWKVLQLGGGSFGGPSDRLFSLQNAIVNPGGNFQYVSGSSTPASGYRQFNGAHDWYTAAAGTSPNTITDFSSPKMTLDASGRLLVGPTSANASGGVLQLSSGITFPATQVASSDANTLDDYEEGTWTPTFTFTTPGTLAISYADRIGSYTKIGRLVTVRFQIGISPSNFVKGTASGQLQISGLPFTVGSAGTQYFDLAASLADQNSGTLVFATPSVSAIFFERLSVSGTRVIRDSGAITDANFAATNAGWITIAAVVTYTV